MGRGGPRASLAPQDSPSRRAASGQPAPFDPNKAIMSIQQDLTEVLRRQDDTVNRDMQLGRETGRQAERVLDMVQNYREQIGDMRHEVGDRLIQRLDERLDNNNKIDERQAGRQDSKLDDIKLLLQQGRAGITGVQGPLVPYDKKDLDLPLDGGGGPGDGVLGVGQGDGTRVLHTKGGNCYFLEEEEQCVCKPFNYKKSDFSKTARNKLRKLAEQKARRDLQEVTA